MKVYIRDIPVKFKKPGSVAKKNYDYLVKSGDLAELKNLSGNVVVETDAIAVLSAILGELEQNTKTRIASLTVPTLRQNELKQYLKERYNYIKAAGGLATKNGRYLFIFRLKKWDLPKGKMEKGEKTLECALREVEEECSVAVEAGPKIGNTWHCYPTKNGWCIKKTAWYLMNCTDDSDMKPQYQEDIEEIVWVHPKNISKYLANSYGNIADVLRMASKKGLLVHA